MTAAATTTTTEAEMLSNNSTAATAAVTTTPAMGVGGGGQSEFMSTRVRIKHASIMMGLNKLFSCQGNSNGLIHITT
jgi:phosphoenolpyruvate synthase/pyruvate phosphate dikinase